MGFIMTLSAFSSAVEGRCSNRNPPVPRWFVSQCGGHLTVTVGNGRGVTLALTLLHHGRPEGLRTLVRWLPGVGQTLNRPHLLSQATLGRALEQKTLSQAD